MDNSIFISIDPYEVVISKETGKGVTYLRNGTGKDYAFKIKTTHPTAYKVNPCIGMLHRNAEVVIRTHTIEKIDPAIIHEHKFLFQFVESMHDLGKEEIKQVFSLKSVKKIEKQINVRYTGIGPTISSNSIENSDQHLVTFIAGIFIAYCSIILIRKIVFGI